MPRPMAYDRSRSANVAKFALETILDINVNQRCLGVGDHVGAYECTYVDDQNWHFGGQLDTSGFYQLVNDEASALV